LRIGESDSGWMQIFQIQIVWTQIVKEEEKRFCETRPNVVAAK